jgi:predicted MFS family arabinose efflux permease
MSPSFISTRRHPALFIAAMVVLVCVAFTFFLGAPQFVALMTHQWRFTQSQIGFVVTADTIGNALGALAVALGIRGWPVRRILGAGTLAIMGGNALIAAGWGVDVAVAGGFLAGVGNGIVSGTAVGFLTYGVAPQRNIAIMVVAENIYAMLLNVGILPGLGGRWEATGVFLFITAVAVVCLPAMAFFGRRETIPAAFREGRVHHLGVWLTLGSLYVFYTSVGVVWTFLAMRAETAGIERPVINQMLGLSNILSLVVCFLVPAMARHSLYGWTLLALILCTASQVLLACPLTATTFAIATIAFVPAWTLTGILLPTHVAGYDPVGRHAALIPAVLGLGYSTGSFVGGVVGEAVSTPRAFQVAAAVACVSVLVLVAQRVLAGKGTAPSASEADLPAPSLVV